MEASIRAILEESGQLPAGAATLALDDDLFDAGLSSLATVSLMLALEEHFGIELPDSLLNRRTFATIRAIRDAVTSLLPAPVAA